MRLPRVRFTIRRMMIVVAILSILFGIRLRYYFYEHEHDYNGHIPPDNPTLWHLIEFTAEAVAGTAIILIALDRLFKRPGGTGGSPASG
jgi:hypothetical protein